MILGKRRSDLITDHEQTTTTMVELDSDDTDDAIEDFKFPNVLNFGAATVKETLYRFKPSWTNTVLNKDGRSESLGVLQSEKTRNWQIFRDCSPVLDAWVRWNKSTEIEEKELCNFLNVSVSSPSLRTVKSYLLDFPVSIPVEELKDMLVISDMLLLDDLANYCKYRIQSIDLNEENFLQILEVSSLYDFVHPEMEYFVMSHLPLLTDMEGSEELTYDSVMFLLTDEVLTYWNMEERFYFITKWCKACVSRNSLFSNLCSLIDMTCLKSVAKTENLGRRSTLGCVNDATFCMTRKQTPVVIINDTQIDEVFAIMLENKQSGNIAFLRDILSVSIVAWTVLFPDCIILITNDNTNKQRGIVKYNMNTRETVSKELRVVGGYTRIDMITQLHCRNDITFFVGHDEFSVPCCTVYMKDIEATDTVWVLPVMSFKFEIKQMCVLKSRLLVKSCSDVYIHCFNWANHTLAKTTIPDDMLSASHSPLLSLLPLNDTICAVFQSYIIQFTFDENTAEMISTRKVYVDIGSDPFFTIATMEGTLVRVDNEYIHVCDSIQNSSRWKSYKLPDRTLPLSEKSVIGYGFLRRNIEMCHQNCPHCYSCFEQFDDGFADFGALYQMKVQKEKERERRKLKTEREREMKLQKEREGEMAKNVYIEDGYDDFYDDYIDDYYDKYDMNDYYEDDFDRFDDEPRMIFLASDDEWVEEWW